MVWHCCHFQKRSNIHIPHREQNQTSDNNRVHCHYQRDKFRPPFLHLQQHIYHNFQNKKPTSLLIITSSLALRLCVWLFHYFHFHIFNFNQHLIFTFRTIKRIIFKQCIPSYLISCFIFAYRTYNPFCIVHFIHLPANSHFILHFRKCNHKASFS